jgi:choice-of-anchor A domain-containing protein
VDSGGNTVIAGNITDNSDITGRIAAANIISGSMTIGSALNGDPYGSSAAFGLVATNGLGSGTQINMNGGGNAYAPGASNSNFNFNDGGTLSTSGPSGLDFNSLRTSLDALTLQLAAQTVNGSNLGTNTPGSGNPSFYVLHGTDPNLNVFEISSAIFGDQNHPIDIQAPVGSTIIINVDGTNPTLGTAIYYNGLQHTDDSADEDILFNFAGASTVNLGSSGLSASVLAPYAILSGTGQIDGTFIAAAIDGTGEVHNYEFTGTLPELPGSPKDPSPIPEPTTLALAGTGMLMLAAAIRRQKLI